MDCPICLSTFNEYNSLPLILPCGHTICKSCIFSLDVMQPTRCPLDRSLVGVPLNELKLNYALQDIMTNYTLSKLNQTQNLSTVCSSGHNLQKSIHSSAIYQNKSKSSDRIIICSHCLLPGLSISYSCCQCNFNLCEKCYCEQAQSAFIQNSVENIKCFNDHLMFRYSFIDSFYLRKYSNFSSVSCDLCRKRWNGASSACRVCCFNLCDDCCFRDFKRLIKRPAGKCVEGHVLEIIDGINHGGDLDVIRCSECLNCIEERLLVVGCAFFICVRIAMD